MIDSRQRPPLPDGRSGTAPHRLDIDGLRALAVTAVVLFHVGALPVGFIGVDIFFVVSGYLMALIVSAELSSGRFSLTGFYARRARRIVPALALVLAAVAVAGSVLLLPYDARELGRSLVASATFTANLRFHEVASDYFSADALLYEPLLHIWTLGVEGQFYLLFPLCMVLAWRFGRRGPALALLAIGLASFAYSAYVVHDQPADAFYFLGSRAWEFIAGALVFLLPPLRRLRHALAALGLACLAVALVAYRPGIAFPGTAALLPALGTAMILYARPGMEPGDRGLAALLATPPIAFTAKISYSLYLWHWPLLAFARYLAGDVLPPWLAVALVVLAVLLAWLSWHLVEQPFLRRPAPAAAPARRMAAPAAMLAAVLVVGFAVKTVVPKHALALLPADVVLTAAAERDQLRDECEPSDGSERFPCRFGSQGQSPELLVWGNSYARMWMPGIDRLATEHGVSGISAIRSACVPSLQARQGDDCHDFNARVLAAVTDAGNGISGVVLSANWGAHDGFSQEMAELFQRLDDAGKQTFFVLGPPRPDYRVPRTLALAALRGSAVPPPQAREGHDSQRDAILAAIEESAARHGVTVIDPTNSFCDDRVCFVRGPADEILYYDMAHITRTASILFRHVFTPVMSRRAAREALATRDPLPPP